VNVIVSADRLDRIATDLFRRFGANETDAIEVSAQLIEASLTGHDSHGVLRIPTYIDRIKAGTLIPGAPVTVIRESPTTALLDGGWGFGQPVSRAAMALAIAKADSQGIACVAIRNANHMGRVGFYTGMAAKAGMVGLGCVNLHGTSAHVAPFGGTERRLSTNPFSVSFPSGRDPDFLMDMTTSVVAEGKVQVRRNRGEPADPGWLIDRDGHPTTDPWALYRDPFGALLTLGGPVAFKGYALSLAVEGLAGGLSGAGCSHPAPGWHGNACWYTVIRIDAFVPLAEFAANVGRMIDAIKESRRAEGVAEILYPGEPEYRTRIRRAAEGIPVDPPTRDRLIALGAEVGLRVDL
jgi:LDH2 family malate/lactate/ureidoglycolate dehydrogenase